MAQTDPTVRGDFNSGFFTPEQSAPLFERAARQSVVMRLARQVPLSDNGSSIPVYTGKATAGWVGEGGTKPTTEGAVGIKSISPKKLAAITVLSAEVVRQNPANYMEYIRNSIVEAFAVAFDEATLHGVNTPFGAGNFIDATTRTAVELGTTAQAAGGTYGDLVAALKTLTDAGVRPTGWAFDEKVEPTFLASTDTTGRPLWIDSPDMSETVDNLMAGRVLRRPAFMGEGVGTDVGEAGVDSGVAGYLGDWTQAVWGVSHGISWKISTEGAVTLNGTLTSLLEKNLVAVIAEAEYGWLVNDPNSFVQLTDTV